MISHASTTAPVTLDERQSYNPDHFAPIYVVEDRHFWFRARNHIISTVVRQIAAGMGPGCRILEVGCGTGNVLRVPQARPQDVVVGMDLFAGGLRYARQRTTCALVQADLGAPPFRASFEIVGLFDVLEHLSDDLEALRALRSLLTPSGTLLLTVPAHASLWSYFDEASHHARRYSRETLKRQLVAAGYRIETLSIA